MPRKSIPFVVLLAALAVAGSWAEEPAKTDENLSADLAYATYGEDQNRVKVVVSSVVAKIENTGEYLPLDVAVGLRGAGPEFVFNFETFELIDGEGTRILAVSPDEIQQHLNVWMETERLRRMRPIDTADYYLGYREVASNFYPKNGGGQTTHLDQEMFFKDVLYFPVPNNLDGVMTLLVEGRGMDAPVQVRFKVPEKHKKAKEKEKDEDQKKDAKN